MRYTISEAAKKLKTGRVPYLGLELAMHGLKSQIHLVRQSLRYWFSTAVGADKRDSRDAVWLGLLLQRVQQQGGLQQAPPSLRASRYAWESRLTGTMLFLTGFRIRDI